MAHSKQPDVLQLLSESLRKLKGKQTFDRIDHDTIIAELGIDSISFAELTISLEEELDVTFADEEATRIRTVGTVGDLERIVSAKLLSKG